MKSHRRDRAAAATPAVEPPRPVADPVGPDLEAPTPTDGDAAPIALAVAGACGGFAGAAHGYIADPWGLPALGAASDDLAALLGALPAFAPQILVSPGVAVMGLDDLAEAARSTPPDALALQRGAVLVAAGLDGVLAEASEAFATTSAAWTHLSVGVPAAANAARALHGMGGDRAEAPGAASRRRADERATEAGPEALWRTLVHAASDLAGAGIDTAPAAMRRLAALLQLVPAYDPPFGFACLDLGAALQAAAPNLAGGPTVGAFVGELSRQLGATASAVLAAEGAAAGDRFLSASVVARTVELAMRVVLGAPAGEAGSGAGDAPSAAGSVRPDPDA